MTARFCVIFIVLASTVVPAQDRRGDAASSPKAPSAPSPTAEGLVSSTLARDIATASYYELAAWCQELGLSDSGSRRDLQARLYLYFKVPVETETAKKGKTISVRSAKESEYFTVSEMNEKYVVLRGEVVVVIADADSGSVQEIHTQNLTFNQTLNLVTAVGGVEYTITRDGKTEVFKGESLTFNVDTGEGAFYNGSTSKQQKVGEAEVTYYFRGNTISRFPNDSVTLENGSFTSCDDEDPHYQMKATRVWILAPGEWALENAVLYVGRIPVLYLPFFFYPGDEIFFNPALGYDDRKGTYMQTTTYLMGRKKKEESPFSFMQLSSTDDEAYDLELHGIFLRKIPYKQGEKKKKTDSTLKVMLDGYSRLGAYAAIAGDFAPLATFQFGVARTRSIFTDSTTGLASPFYQGDEKSHWNRSSIFGLDSPLRFGMKGEVKTAGEVGSVNAHFEYYSDPFFTEDFYTRSEGLKLTSDLETLLAESEPVSLQSNLSWDLSSQFDFSKSVKSSWFQTLSMPYLNAKFTWQSREAPYTSGTPEAADPGRMFYYPSSLVAPDASLSIGGEILRYSKASAKASTPQDTSEPKKSDAKDGVTPDPGKGFRAPPAPAPASSTKTEKSDGHFTFRAPQRQKDVDVTGRGTETSASLTYQVQPRATLEQTFDSSKWEAQEDVDFKLLYSTFETGGSSQLSGNVSFMDKVIDNTLTLTADGTYRTRTNQSSSITDDQWEDLLNGDLMQDQLSIRGIFQNTLKPLAYVSSLSDSNIAYKFNTRLYQLTASGSDPDNPQMDSFGPSWDKDSISEHSLQGSLALKALGQTDTLTLTSQLPPLDPDLVGTLDVNVWISKTHMQGGATQTEGTWVLHPFIASETLQFADSANVSEELQFDTQAGNLDRSTSQLKLWGFYSSFTAERLFPVTVTKSGFTLGDSEKFLPSTFRTGYEYTGDPVWFWKNRVKLNASVKTDWNMDLQRFTENELDFTLALNLSIFRFLDLSFTAVSYNNKTYRYFPWWRDQLEEPLSSADKNPFLDLIRSFDFFNSSNRYDSAFKLKSLSLKAVNHLHDWDLTLEYQGSPQLRTLDNGKSQYQWNSVFAIQVQWVPVPEIHARTHGDYTGFYLRD